MTDIDEARHSAWEAAKASAREGSEVCTVREVWMAQAFLDSVERLNNWLQDKKEKYHD